MVEKIVKDLKNIFTFKQSTGEGDIVLIIAENLVYAYVSSIERDVSRKEEWWQVSMQLLTIPPQKIVWTLREPQFTGQEIFTMGGEPRFVAAIDFGGGRRNPKKISDPPLALEGKKKKKPILKVIK